MNLDLNWPDADGGTSGVHDRGGSLTWWRMSGAPNGEVDEETRTQSVADFLAHGPALPAPDGVVERVRAYLYRQR